MSGATDDRKGICSRLAEARVRTFGQRGKAAFARALGLSPTTYIYYEKGRVPPPDVLARAAEVAGVRLEWLITGEEPRDKTLEQVRAEWSPRLPAELQPALDRFIEGTAGGKDSAAALRALAETLSQVRDRFPAARGGDWQSQRMEKTEGMIPILGRTAAGLVGDFAALLGGEPEVTMADIARRALGLDVHRKRAADVDTDDSALEPLLAGVGESVSLVQLGEPLPSGVVEFIDAPALRGRYSAAFAVRVDGESMTPRFRHGDVVIAVAGRDVRPGQAALIQIRGRVGLTLKLVRREADAVYLVPINENYETQRVDGAEVEWLAPVLFTVRF